MEQIFFAMKAPIQPDSFPIVSGLSQNKVERSVISLAVLCTPQSTIYSI
jgi:hypothetical protein